MSSISERQQELKLQQARQSGQAPPAVDSKTNAIINPHNPDFITKRPWYLGGGDEGPSLEHQGDQRLEEDKLELSLSAADALLQQARKVTTFQVGMWVEAMKNNRMPYQMCQVIKIAKNGREIDLKYEDGSVERKIKLSTKPTDKPRVRRTKTGNRAHVIDAKIFGKETYDSKRDSYLGFDGDSHLKNMEAKFKSRDDMRKDLLLTTTAKQNTKDADQDDADSDSDMGSDDSEDEFVVKDEDAKTFTSRLARQGGVGGAQMKVTARNLRIREDTAKYLRNLDVNSAYYDPKSRSMRDNPNPEQGPEESQYAGDNAARISGDAVGLAETQLFSWDVTGKIGTTSIHPQANPSQAELLKKEYKVKATDLMAKKKKAVLDKYGGAEYLDGGGGLATAAETKPVESAAARKARFGVSVTQEEYTRDGRLLQNGVAVKRAALPCKYQEDVYSNGHTTVWGSYFHRGAFKWGYKDDHSLIRNSYCTGANGKVVNDEANEMKYGTGVAGSAALAQAREMLKAIPDRKAGESLKPLGSKLYGEADLSASIDKEKLQAAMKKLEQDESHAASSDRKRKYNSVGAIIDVTEEEMEAYRIRKDRGMADPMTNLEGDKLLEYK